MTDTTRLVDIIEECVIHKTNQLFGKYVDDGYVVGTIEHQGWIMINEYDKLDNIKVVQLRYIGMGHFKVMCEIISDSDTTPYITMRVGGYLMPHIEIPAEIGRLSKITEGTMTYDEAINNIEEVW